MHIGVYGRLKVQYPVYMTEKSLFPFENAGFCDMMKMVYFMDMPSTIYIVEIEVEIR